MAKNYCEKYNEFLKSRSIEQLNKSKEIIDRNIRTLKQADKTNKRILKSRKGKFELINEYIELVNEKYCKEDN